MASTTMSLKSLNVRPAQAFRCTAPRLPARSRASVQVKADFFGSPANLLVCGCTTLFLVAGRFGLAPTTNKLASAGLKLEENKAGLVSGDPSGFTIVDVLYLGTAGHAVAIGICLGLKGIGAI
eukprot:TRINITY_DN1503_c1_g1_i1.p2 TRINITY_DN1503_c1_g1~~TRINITY_DN1503_c1_g1_i1.p2  ORF type:complete len:123 (-),score=29.55 TRINITY_DN1503_c1_g1_i1:148-516(-)